MSTYSTGRYIHVPSLVLVESNSSTPHSRMHLQSAPSHIIQTTSHCSSLVGHDQY